MYPLLDFGFIQLSSYSFFTVAALIAVVGGSYWFGKKRKFKESDLRWMLFGMGLSAFVGARFFNVLVNFDWYQDDPVRIIALNASGFSLYGGIFGAIFAGGVISYVRKIPLFKFADTVTPFIGLGIALQRVGCFLNGCCFGKETDVTWGVKFPTFSQPHLHQISGNLFNSVSVHAVHPTEIYELIAALVGTMIAFLLIKRGRVDGTAFLVCGMYFSAFRWLNMQFRVLPYSEMMLNVWYPLFYLAIILVCGGVLLIIRRKYIFN